MKKLMLNICILRKYDYEIVNNGLKSYGKDNEESKLFSDNVGEVSIAFDTMLRLNYLLIAILIV